MTIEGRCTIAAYNSVGIAYSWDTTIKSITEDNNIVTVIHKPKGSKTAYRHTYDKDQELKIYKGFLGIDLMKDTMFSYDESAFSPLKQYESKLIYQF